jgi:hypothetical protein
VSALRYEGSPTNAPRKDDNQVPVAAHGIRSMSKESRRELVSAVLRAGGRMWVRGGGASMFPTIRPGERVLLEPCSREPRLGDIVALRGDRCILVHRIVDCSGGTIRTRGDASPRTDAPVRSSHIVGLATAVMRDGRVVALGPTLRHGPVPLCLFAYHQLRRRVGAAVRFLLS